MKKVLTLVAAFTATAALFAQDPDGGQVAATVDTSFIYVLKDRFIEGGAVGAAVDEVSPKLIP